MKSGYADIVIPVAVTGSYTYAVPEAMADAVYRGSLVRVPFGQRESHIGLVIKVHGNKPAGFEAREITEVLPGGLSMGERLTSFLTWMADYYMAYPGEVLRAALPSPERLATVPRRKKSGSTVSGDDEAVIPPFTLSTVQQAAYEKIKDHFDNREVVLLHGVTSSGKTEIYIHLITDIISKGRQALYMLPEISLTTQIIERLQRHFGEAIGVYHSRLTPAARTDVWRRVSSGALSVVLGVRSSLFLPFRDLGVIIVDEEHDSSYKQHDPSPRYHARDSAVMLARQHGALTLLGSATPSAESYHNALTDRYGLVELLTRHGEVMMPEMIVADTRRGITRGSARPHFTPRLIEAVKDALSDGRQVILFQNRRGFSPFIMCPSCGWVHRCGECSVSSTYHKSIKRMVCHYCGRSEPVPDRCPECGSEELNTRGFGTEKIEEEIRILFPSARVARMDQDTTRRSDAFSDILSAFARGETDILIGTQMISKGLDFGKLTVVGILDADSMLWFPDFRAFERSFQLIEQVSGRAGRRASRGKVIIQTADPSHVIIRQAVKHDYRAMVTQQLEERKLFGYPPFTRMISITLRHRDEDELVLSAGRLAASLRTFLGPCVLGPEAPPVSQVQKWFIRAIMIRIGREISPAKAKEMIRRAIEAELKMPRRGIMRIHADVDPQ